MVNIHVESAAGNAVPEIAIEDHWGTVYTFRDSASMGSRNLQVFTPSVPPGTRSLTIRSTDAAEARLVVTFAVPVVHDADELDRRRLTTRTACAARPRSRARKSARSRRTLSHLMWVFEQTLYHFPACTGRRELRERSGNLPH